MLTEPIVVWHNDSHGVRFTRRGQVRLRLVVSWNQKKEGALLVRCALYRLGSSLGLAYEAQHRHLAPTTIPRLAFEPRFEAYPVWYLLC